MMKKLILVIPVFVLLLAACDMPGGAAQPTPIDLSTAVPTAVAVVETEAAAAPTQQFIAGKEGDTHVAAADAMVMVFIPGGKYYIGGVDTDAHPDEKPAHNVTLSSFWMDQLEVTNGMYSLCVKAGNCTPPRELKSSTHKSYFGSPDFNDFPVIQVSWQDASNYCEWAGRRLPTEAEWEAAARGNADYRRFPWGEQDADKTLANYGYTVRDTSRVGSYPTGASPFGILDMAGNVWEWVVDYYDAGYYAKSDASAQDSTGPKEAVGPGLRRVIRGGSWVEGLKDARVSSRAYGASPDLTADPTSAKFLGDANDHTGFRCAATAGK